MPTRRLPAAVLTITAILTTIACGGSGGDDDAATTTTSTTAAAGPAAAAAIELDVAVHYAGFLITLDDATLEDGLVLVEGRVENLGNTSSRPPSNVTLDLGATSVALDSFESQLDEVPGDSLGELVYAFTVDDDVEIDDAILYIGGADFARAVVPFGDEGELVANEPIEVEITGAVVAGSSTFTLHGGEVRFDVPDDHDAAEAGKAFLTVDFTVTNNSDFPGGYAFVQDDLRLKTPAGISLAPDDAPIELLQPQSSLPDLFVRWIIDVDDTGSYTFIGLRNVGSDDQTQGELTFTLPALT